jgi:transcriptional regulator with GAF, ATPase, and Fis domain
LDESAAARIRTAFAEAGLDFVATDARAERSGVVCFACVTDELLALLNDVRRSRVAVLAVAASPGAMKPGEAWRLLNAGAADTLVWPSDGSAADQVRARLDRWTIIDELAIEAARKASCIGAGTAWIDLIRRVVEAARFADAPVLLIGESGTGKELLARLIHLADARADRRSSSPDLVTVDCSTIVPELSGSEFFGHEKGAFTGAIATRDGAFAAADGGTLFLDEVGELSLGLQVQLLRVVQEKTYKRVGGNIWQSTDFRLVSATNRDLAELVTRGQFRLDLYHRLAGWVFRLPSLRERREDILPLAAHFLKASLPGKDPLDFDEAVRTYLVNREYPGNIRELRQLINRVAHRHVGPGPITAGDIPPEDRPGDDDLPQPWPDERLDQVIEDAISRGVGLKEISNATAEAAIRLALKSEDGNLQRAARRLGVTDRALQMRRASKRTAS